MVFYGGINPCRMLSRMLSAMLSRQPFMFKQVMMVRVPMTNASITATGTRAIAMMKQPIGFDVDKPSG